MKLQFWPVIPRSSPFIPIRSYRARYPVIKVMGIVLILVSLITQVFLRQWVYSETIIAILEEIGSENAFTNPLILLSAC